MTISKIIEWSLWLKTGRSISVPNLFPRTSRSPERWLQDIPYNVVN